MGEAKARSARRQPIAHAADISGHRLHVADAEATA
jgi:hypothetical protein